MSLKENMFKRKFIDTFNPKEPSDKLMKHLDSIILPSSGYLSKTYHKSKLLDLEPDGIDYIAYRCKGCTSEVALMAKLVDYIQTWEEIDANGDDEDRYNYEQEFREEFKMYKINFEAICTTKLETTEAETSIDSSNRCECGKEIGLLDTLCSDCQKKGTENIGDLL